jgi:hypothetical protein
MSAQLVKNSNKLIRAEPTINRASQRATSILSSPRYYGYKLSKVPLLCDNESAIRMADNPVEHSRTKHIDIRYHFLRDHQQKAISKLLMSITKTN